MQPASPHSTAAPAACAAHPLRARLRSASSCVALSSASTSWVAIVCRRRSLSRSWPCVGGRVGGGGRQMGRRSAC